MENGPGSHPEKPTKAELKHAASVILSVGVPTVAIAMWLDNYINPLLIWGGTNCNAAGEVQACFGYAPGGLAAITVVVSATVAAVYGYARSE